MMQLLIWFSFCVVTVKADPYYSVDLPSDSDNDTVLPTRRIMGGRRVRHTRPYMVHLRPAKDSSKDILEAHWICGGVIIDARHILTSAACIEDAKHFYVISGTHKWYDVDVYNNKCINNGAKRALSKLVPKSYYYDGHDFDNIRWMVGDIAVVKVEDEFNFERRILGCDFIPKKIDYNNFTIDYERSGTVGSVAGWGSTEEFMDLDKITPEQPSANSVDLLETDVVVVSKKGCKNHWDERYHSIIDEEMICSKDVHEQLTSECLAQGTCREIEEYSDNDYYDNDAVRSGRRMEDHMVVHTAVHQSPTRRRFKPTVGGFCENDHGGPLVVGQGRAAVVVGVMSACLTKEMTHKCRGPFLYTSVYKYRNLIACAIGTSRGTGCKYLLRSENSPIINTRYRWEQQREGPAINEHLYLRQNVAHQTNLSNTQESIPSTNNSPIDTQKINDSSQAFALDQKLRTDELDPPESLRNESSLLESQRDESDPPVSQRTEPSPPESQRDESDPPESQRTESKKQLVESKLIEPPRVESKPPEILWSESVPLETQQKKSGRPLPEWVEPIPSKAWRFESEPSASTRFASELMGLSPSTLLAKKSTDLNAKDGGIKKVMMRRYFRRRY